MRRLHKSFINHKGYFPPGSRNLGTLVSLLLITAFSFLSFSFPQRLDTAAKVTDLNAQIQGDCQYLLLKSHLNTNEIKIDLEKKNKKSTEDFKRIRSGPTSHIDTQSFDSKRIKIMSENEKGSFRKKDYLQFENPKGDTGNLSFEISIK